MDRRILIAGVLLATRLGSPVPSWASPACPPGARPNVLLVIWDDVAQRDVRRIPTPTFDALAARGVRCRRAYGAPVCSPARRSLMFGYYWTRSAGDACQGSEDAPPVEHLSLPRMFERAGYATALFGKWHLGDWPGRADGSPWELSAQAHGFDVWRAGVSSNVEVGCEPGTYTDWQRVQDGRSERSSQYQTWAVRRDFLEWLAERPAEVPWFAVLAFQAPHTPLHIPPNKNQSTRYQERDLYELMLTEADAAVGRVLEAVDLERAVVLLVADNGTPPVAVHPMQDPQKVKKSAYEDGIRVPMVWAGAGIPRHVVSDSPVAFVDVLPTLAELAGIDLEHGAPADGVSLVRLFAEPDWEPHDYVFAGAATPQVPGDFAVIGSRWKYREDQGEPFLFDLETDPREAVNLSGRQDLTELEHGLERRLRSYLAD